VAGLYSNLEVIQGLRSGGIGTIIVALLWMKLFPTLRDVERLE